MRVARTILLLLVAAALSTGCDLLEPCERPKVQGLSGNWRIQTVNGGTMPANGFPIPLSADRLRTGSLRFQVQSHSGGCSDEGKQEGEFIEKGTVIAIYNLASPNTNLRPTRTYAGSYEYNAKTLEIVMRANGRSVRGIKLASELSFAGTIPLLGSLVVDFRKAP